MTINGNQKTRNVYSIPESDIPKARAFIQGAVYDWCKNRPDEVFAVRDLFGGVNTDWGKTPLQATYNHWSSTYRKRYPKLSTDELHKKAAKQAAIDVGWLAKSVLQDDRRKFKSSNAGKARGYKWVGEN